mmetsp:Transcript_37927/g.114589  ORF Transcript_37927/g.114589 Transcript_37927/m.114589 type:complete len:103 (-) Transcript_37927:1265-1573(-)
MQAPTNTPNSRKALQAEMTLHRNDMAVVKEVTRHADPAFLYTYFKRSACQSFAVMYPSCWRSDLDKFQKEWITNTTSAPRPTTKKKDIIAKFGMTFEPEIRL